MANQNVNKIMLIGNLGNDPELRKTAKGKTVANFSLATSVNRKDESGAEKKDTTWHRAVAWGKTAENAGKYLHKGDRVYLEGTLRARNYQDKNGVIRKSVEVMVERINYLTTKGGAFQAEQNQSENMLTH